MKESISVELRTEERDFLLDFLEYILLDDMVAKLTRPKPNKNGFISVRMRLHELEDLIGNLSAEGNHCKKRTTQELAHDLAENLESYEYSLKMGLTPI